VGQTYEMVLIGFSASPEYIFSHVLFKQQATTYLEMSILPTSRTVLYEHELFVSAKLKVGSISILNSVHERKTMTNSFYEIIERTTEKKKSEATFLF